MLSAILVKNPEIDEARMYYFLGNMFIIFIFFKHFRLTLIVLFDRLPNLSEVIEKLKAAAINLSRSK